MIVECSNYIIKEEKYFRDKCDYILNLWDKKELFNIFGKSKFLDKGTMTIYIMI